MTIETNGEPADVDVPDSGLFDTDACYRIALLSQEANRNKSFYSGFAATLATHGFMVVVPDHSGVLSLGLLALSGAGGEKGYRRRGGERIGMRGLS